jgi:hypothetical protein
MAGALGVYPSKVSRLVNGRLAGKGISRSLHSRVVKLYNQLWNKWGESSYAHKLAAERGYASPLAWDEHALDDPKAKPLGVAQGSVELPVRTGTSK